MRRSNENLKDNSQDSGRRYRVDSDSESDGQEEDLDEGKEVLHW